MRFNCGPTLAERRQRKLRLLQDWHIWFAWRPVRLQNQQCVWLEFVLRKGKVHNLFRSEYDFYNSIWTWEYQELN